MTDINSPVWGTEYMLPEYRGSDIVTKFPNDIVFDVGDVEVGGNG
jgi:hypothetical protein